MTVPALFVWSDRDTALTRDVAEEVARHVDGPFRYAELRGVSHWIPDEAPASPHGAAPRAHRRALPPMEVLAGRVLIHPIDLARSTAFYRDVLGLAVVREFPGGTVFFLGGGYLKLSGSAGDRSAPRACSCGCRSATSPPCTASWPPTG